jgi:hypothetical protein
VADLAVRHQRAAVYPVVLVTDPGARDVPDRWAMTVAGVTMSALRVRVYQPTAAELPRLRSLQNRVAAMLTNVVKQDAVDAVVATLEHMARSPGPFDDLNRFLPFAVKLASTPESHRPRFRRRPEEAGMVNVILLMEEEARAEGRAEGRAEALVRASRATVMSYRRLVERGILSREVACCEVQNLMDTGAVTREIGQEALSLLQ